MSTPELPPAPAPAPVAAPAKKSNTLVIVLCVVLGVFVLIIGSCVGTCFYVGKKAKEYAKESEKNPQLSTLALAAAMYPGVEVVSKDLEAGTLVLKNKKTGEIVKVNAKDFSTDRIGELLEKIAQGKGVNVALKSSGTTSGSEPASTAPAGPAESAGSERVSAAQSAAQDATLKTFPSDFPLYTGGGAINVEANQNVFSGVSTSLHVFVTSDLPVKVAEYYEKKLAADGYTVVASENGSDENGAKLSRIFQKTAVGAVFNLTVHIEDGKTHVEASQVVQKP